MIAIESDILTARLACSKLFTQPKGHSYHPFQELLERWPGIPSLEPSSVLSTSRPALWSCMSVRRGLACAPSSSRHLTPCLTRIPL